MTTPRLLTLAYTILLTACTLPAAQDICGPVPPDMRCIPGGSYLRGLDRETIDEDSKRRVRDESPVTRIEVSPFLLDTYEVAAVDFDRCASEGKCRPVRTVYRGYSEGRMPKLGISWYDARDYCKVQGKRLPTEAEWEFAARGPASEQFPWGNAPATCKLAIIRENGVAGCGTGKTWDAGSRPVERYGLYDMGGNAWEWVSDWYSPSYGACGAACSGKDPKGPCDGRDTCPGAVYKIVRGGSWFWEAEYSRSGNRRPHFPANKPYHHFGFRCARDAAP